MQISLVGKPQSTPKIGVTDIKLNPDHKFVKVWHDMGLSDEKILEMVVLIQPLIAEHLQERYAQVVSIPNLVAIDQEAAERDFNQEQIEQMYALAYEQFSGRKLDSEVEIFLNDLADKIVNTRNDVHGFLDKFKSSEQVSDQEILNYIDETINARN